ncbi:MAG: hypothetical protein ACTHWW_02565 [Arthrobacter sp.]|uniref:hypothetical protein n=1 Tax=unclassified Arthrobacter TaxID=235627 RepID=UPI00265696F9|nr:hypothetical protein [Micrococcaceae bacterium]MDN5813066.1 hypothetical protein [Micrococcaceae bacterium]MDN5822900.1 hypothetical protein [Micrococcaceae bacterium]MDN5879351.1 hypothetical protein [Micrococcaceae bacterium]MDN5887197.1 hypothetical protein [Micrococcaceae bacterium]
MKRPAAGQRGRTVWIGPLSFGVIALGFCLYTRIDAGHTAVFTALGVCVGYLFTILPLLTFSTRIPLDPGRPANGNQGFRALSFALLSKRLSRHSPAARGLEHAVGTAVRFAGDPEAVGPATVVAHRELQAGRDLTSRQATAAAHEVDLWFSQAPPLSALTTKGRS